MKYRQQTHTLDGIWKLSLNYIHKLHNLHLVYSQQTLCLFVFLQNCNKTDVCDRHAPASQSLKNISQLAKSSDKPLCASHLGSFILLNLAHNIWC